MKIIWSPLAIDRASEIAEYIAQDKLSAAEKWISTVFSIIIACFICGWTQAPALVTFS
jgi:hypothetical protein